jgi:orotidine-5'-phosphate decarboxylase
LRYGLPAVVKAIHEVANILVIYDHQKAGTDIPQMGKPFATVCANAGVRAAIFFPLSGPKTLEGFVSAAMDADLIPIVGLVMTHPAYLQSEGGYIVDAAPDSICNIAISMGVRSFVLPGTKTDIVKRFARGPLAQVAPATVMMPGIGSQGGSIASAFKAAAPHNPFAIVGSALYNNPDPPAMLQSLIAEIQK